MIDSKRTRVIGGILATLLALIVISPILYCAISSLYTEAQFYYRPIRLMPSPVDIINYQ
ncbi:MAG: hypothetical protein MJ136_07780 [Clostridia bacterium]|nr:hypothetical protein [Clostridia bacterium]